MHNPDPDLEHDERVFEETEFYNLLDPEDL